MDSQGQAESFRCQLGAACGQDHLFSFLFPKPWSPARVWPNRNGPLVGSCPAAKLKCQSMSFLMTRITEWLWDTWSWQAGCWPKPRRPLHTTNLHFTLRGPRKKRRALSGGEAGFWLDGVSFPHLKHSNTTPLPFHPAQIDGESFLEALGRRFGLRQ